jgi:excisionase family DNA binding protein
MSDQVLRGTRVDAFDEDGLCDVKDVARLLKASVSWVYKAAEKGSLPCIRIGAMLRFEPAAIRTWLAAQRGGSSLTGAPHQSVTGPSAPSTRGEG